MSQPHDPMVAASIGALTEVAPEIVDEIQAPGGALRLSAEPSVCRFVPQSAHTRLLQRSASEELTRARLSKSQVATNIDETTALLYDIPKRKEGLHMSAPTTISSKGQVTVPRDVRERLGLQAGDKIAWSMLSNGTIVLRPKTRRLADLVGILTQPGQLGVSVDEMRLPE